MANWRELPRDHRKIIYKKDESSTTTYGWTVKAEREPQAINEVLSHGRWTIKKVVDVTKKGY